MTGMDPHEADGGVPGTVHLVDLDGTVGGKHSNAHKDIVLVPAPSLHPDDPLMWSKKRKYVYCFCLFSYCMGVGVSSASIYSVLTNISEATGISVADLNHGTGYMFLLFGYGCIFWQLIVSTLGKRFSFCSSLLLTAAINMWAPYTTTTSQWYASRILIGLVGAPIEYLCEVGITDVFFQHERGQKMALYGATLFISNFIAPLPSGYVADAIGWRWVLYLTAILNLVCFFICFFFMEETNFDRAKYMVAESRAQTPGDSDDKEAAAAYVASSDSSIVIPDRPASMLRRMKLVSIPDKIPALLPMIYRPFYALTFPVIAWSGFMYGTCLCLFNIYNGTVAVVFTSSTYGFSSGTTGLTYFGPIIGSFIGAYLSGPLSDIVSLKLARRNGGIQEPEFRLWLFFIPIVFLPAALILWGVGYAHGVHWFGLIVAAVWLCAGMVFGCMLPVQYGLDTYHALGSEVVVPIILVRNSMSFAIGYGLNPWIDNLGYQNAFIVAAAASIVFVGTFLVFIKWGKQMRAASKDRYFRFLAGSTGN